MKKILIITLILGMLFVMTCHCVYAATTDECINNTEDEPGCKDCCDCLDDTAERRSCRENCQTHDFSLNSDFITVDAPSSLGPDGDYSAALDLDTESACKEYCDTSSELLCGDRRYCRDEDDPLIGDIDNSGSIDLKDAIIALQVCAGKSLQTTLNSNADVNGDGHLGIEEAVFAVRFTAGFVNEFTLSSIAISDGELLESYKCETKVNGVEDSIPLSWSNVPDSTGSLAVIMHSYPNPNDTSSVNSYLLLWGIDPSVTGIAHGEADDGSWFMGANKDGVAISYTSPCSPSAGSHEYTITLYALSQTPPSLPDESTKDVDYSVLKTAIDTVTTLGTATLTFNDVTGEEEFEDLAVYEIVNGDPGSVRFLADANGVNVDKYEEVWAIFTQLIPQPYRSYVTQYTIFSDGPDGLPAQMGALDPQYQTFEILFNLDFGYTDDQLNDLDTKYILLHEFGHILTLYQSEFANKTPKDEATSEEIAACEAHYTDEGCLTQSSYFNAFFQEFWVDIIDERSETPLSGPAYAGGSDPFFDAHQDQFVTAYAATSPGEDIAESWTEFVISERPTGNSAIDRKILFFYNYPELVQIRNYAQPSL